MNVEVSGFARATLPRHDVRCTQRCGIGYAGQRASALLILDQARAENILADAMDDKPFGLGGCRQALDLRLELPKRCIR